MFPVSNEMKIQNKIYLIVTIYAIIILFLIVFLIYPNFKDIKYSSLGILLNKNRANFINLEIKEIDNFKKKYEEYKPNLEKVDKLFIDSKNPIDFVKFLETISSESKLFSDISLISSQKNKDNNVSVAVFQMHVSGDISNVLNFIKKLEKGPYLVEIQKIIIKESVEDNNDDKEDIHKNNVDANFLIDVVIE